MQHEAEAILVGDERYAHVPMTIGYYVAVYGISRSEAAAFLESYPISKRNSTAENRRAGSSTPPHPMASPILR
jgi:hypothetical protein